MGLESRPPMSLQQTLADVGIYVESELDASQVYETYMQRLMAVVQRNLADRFKSRVDPEDVMQSVLRTWVRRSAKGEFTLADEDELWKLLCVIALNKVRKVVTRHSAQKRDVAQTKSGEDVVKVIPEPGVNQAVEFLDLLEAVQKRLTPEAQQVLDLRLQGFGDKEIAVEMNLSTRTVSRHKVRVQGVLSELIGDQTDQEASA